MLQSMWALSQTFLQTEQVNTDPIDDDLASLALDILVGEKGITRGGKNLFWME